MKAICLKKKCIWRTRISDNQYFCPFGRCPYGKSIERERQIQSRKKLEEVTREVTDERVK